MPEEIHMNSSRDNFDPNLVTQFLNQYHDRGMMKWQGFYLSDHTASLNKIDQQDAKRLNRKHSEQMTSEEIQTAINIAITKHLPVKIELDFQDKDGYIAPFIAGKIAGYYQDKLIINNDFIAIDTIYAIKLQESNN